MRKLTAGLVATTLLAAACSGGPSDDSTVDDGTATESELDPTTTPVATEPPRDEPDEVEPVDERSSWEQLEAFTADPSTTEVDRALAEFAVLFAPAPGGPTLTGDDTIHPSASHVLDELDRLRDLLTPEQQMFIDEQVDAVFGEDRVIAEFALYPPGSEPQGESAAPEGEGFARPFARSTPPDAIRTAILDVAESLRGVLGGPPLKIYVSVVDRDTLGEAGARNTGLTADSPRRAEFAEEGLDIDCELKLREDYATDPSLSGMVVHELVHCWHWTRIAFDLPRWEATGKWMREGLPSWFGEVVGGTTRFQAEWWLGYTTPLNSVDKAWPMFDRTYDAIGFWARVAEAGDMAAAARAAVDASPDDAAMFDAAIGARASWAAAGTVQRADWGAGWTADGPGMPTRVRQVKSHEVTRTAPVVIDEQPGHQRNHVVDVVPVAGEAGSVMTLGGSGRGVIRVDPSDVVLAGARFEQDWCIGECLCPDATSPFPPDRTRAGDVQLTASLVGDPRSGTQLTVGVDAFDPAVRCEPEDSSPPVLGVPGATGLIGTWRATNGAIALAFAQTSVGGSGPGLDVAGATGDLVMVFEQGGTGTLTYSAVTIYINDESIPDLTLNGGGTFAWGGSGGDLTITGLDYAVTVSSTALGVLGTLTDEDLPSGTTDLSGLVAGDQLTITGAVGSAGEVFFPISWTRE